jgi:cytochrome c553
MMMKSMTRLLALAAAALAVHVPAVAQDAQRGKTLAATCIGCHGIVGYQASFPEIHKVPMISGQTGKYIVAALNAYKKGDRKHPTMRGIAISLTDADMADLGAFYESQGAAKATDAVPAAPANVAALLTKGACASCHGANYSKPIDGAYPKLAGQHADYLFVALKAYSVEGNPHVGRANAIMGAQVKPFSKAELQAMAKYLSKLPSDLQVVPQSRFR